MSDKKVKGAGKEPPERVRIGLEVHVQLKTNTKLFCTCPTNYRDADPNSNICPVCTAQPGSKPNGLNATALDSIVRIGLFIGCRVIKGEEVRVLRKHYFYPDLPSNYQRTSLPVGVDGRFASIRIREVHLEEDPGRYELRDGQVDYNRSGIPLVEIVTEPDMSTPQEARDFLRALSLALSYLGVARDEPGSMRCDANVSVGEGTRVEVKNINSFKGVYRALDSEIRRHRRFQKFGKRVVRETRHWDEAKMITIPLRKKEGAADYRFIPDPDVPALVIDNALVTRLEEGLPERPTEKEARFIKRYGLDPYTASVLVLDLEVADLFEKVAERTDPVTAAAWLKDELRRVLNYNNLRLSETTITAGEIVEVLELFRDGTITDLTARRLFEWLAAEPRSIRQLIGRLGLGRIAGEDELTHMARQVIEEHPKAVDDYMDGKVNSLNFLVGMVMKASGGKSDPKLTRNAIEKLLGAERLRRAGDSVLS